MSMFSGPTEHAANPPETWQVVKDGDRLWKIQTATGTTINTYGTKTHAVEAIETVWRPIYERETRWYAGEQIAGWKSWESVKAEHAATARRLAERGRTGLAERVTRLTERLRNEHRAVSSDPMPEDVVAWARWYAATYPGPMSATLTHLVESVESARAEIARTDALVSDLAAA